MAQRFKELKMLFVLDKNRKLESFIQMVFFHKIDGSFYSSIESNGLVEIQECIYTVYTSFELI